MGAGSDGRARERWEDPVSDGRGGESGWVSMSHPQAQRRAEGLGLSVSALSCDVSTSVAGVVWVWER